MHSFFTCFDLGFLFNSLSLFMLCLFASEAPCRHIVELAKAEVEENPTPSKAMKEPSKIREEDAEVGCHKVFKKYKLSCDIEIGHVNLGQRELRDFPYIKFSTWLYYLGLRRICRQLCGTSSLGKMKAVLQEFWNRYEKIDGGHEIFERSRSGQIDLKVTIPYYCHADEGRSYKKEAIWIFSAHGAIGRGTRSYLKKKHLAPIQRNQQGLNFVSPTWSTQFLFATLLREISYENPEAMEKIISLFSDDAASLANEGIEIDNQKLWLVNLGVKGDLPALSKMGSFKRSFLNAPRGPSSKKKCMGVCHQCRGGLEGDAALGTSSYPYEDLSEHPCWEPTIEQAVPWNQEPTIMRGMLINPQKKSQFFHFDIWHIFHLGIAKQFLGASFVVLVESSLPVLAAFTSVESKFKFITTEYQSFCKARRFSMWIKEINRETLLWPQSSANPVGKWNKGSASTTIMQFLGYFCDKYVTGQTNDELLLLVVPW